MKVQRHLDEVRGAYVFRRKGLFLVNLIFSSDVFNWNNLKKKKKHDYVKSTRIRQVREKGKLGREKEQMTNQSRSITVRLTHGLIRASGERLGSSEGSTGSSATVTIVVAVGVVDEALVPTLASVTVAPADGSGQQSFQLAPLLWRHVGNLRLRFRRRRGPAFDPKSKILQRQFINRDIYPNLDYFFNC
jgi:hypothetical protein